MKRIFCRFVKSREIHNFLVSEHDKMLADRRKRAARYEVLKHTKGKRSHYEG